MPGKKGRGDRAGSRHRRILNAGRMEEKQVSRVLPILFNVDMVREILDGRKTVTRRVIMPHNRRRAKEQGYCQKNGLWVDPRIDNGDATGHIKDYSVSSCWMRYSSYIAKYAPYQSEDILYVRETWAFAECITCDGIYNRGQAMNCYDLQAVEYNDGSSISDGCFIYRADSKNPEKITWHPSIHMPKQAARIWLRVADVRVERLHEMNTGDFLAEGVSIRPEAYNDPENARQQARAAFIEIWDSTIKKEDRGKYGWEANPWVWVIEFERCEKPE